VVDVFNDFDHEDGERLLASFRERAPNMRRAIDTARGAGVPIVYVNDEGGGWRSDASALIRKAVNGAGGELIRPLVPQAGDPILLKHRYSAFDHTPLEILLGSREIARVVLVGAATEGCVVQTAIDARELGLLASIIANACVTTDSELERIALRYASLVGGIHVEEITNGDR
jgi:nicotinamidase-related amidase